LQPGKPQSHEYRYQRNNICNLFVFFEPRNGWRHVEVTNRRTKQDFARCMQQLVDGYSPEAEVIRVVVDNLNMHTPAAFSGVFPPTEAHRILQRVVFHYTPKQGRWLNLGENELSVLTGPCVKRRLPDKATVQQEIAAWERQRNAAQATVQ